MKKIISLTLSTLVFLTSILTFAGVAFGAEEKVHDGITYECVGNKLSVISVDPSIKVLNIAKKLEIDGVLYTVTSIKSRALDESTVEVVNLPEEGIDIDGYVFRGLARLVAINNLEKSNILGWVDYFFDDCCNLRSVKLPENLSLIGEGMFFGCTQLENITITKNIQKIGKDSFFGCSNLKKVDVEEKSGLQSIEKGAFAGCENLEYFNMPENINKIDEYAFFDCKKLDLSAFKSKPNVFVSYDKNLEEKSQKAEAFVNKILENEIKNGRDPGELVDARDIDRLLYKYTPRSTDTPNVLGREEFDKLTSDGRLVLYRGDLPCVSKNGREITIKEINDAFKYGDYYYPFELNGIFCTKYLDHAKTYARDYESKKMIGSVTQFCFTDTSPENLKVITNSELYKIQDFYKYSHIKNNLKFMHDWRSLGRYRLDVGLKNLGIDTMNFSFMARALGCDLIDNECDSMGEDGCEKDVPTSQFEVLNRGKLTVCSENIF